MQVYTKHKDIELDTGCMGWGKHQQLVVVVVTLLMMTGMPASAAAVGSTSEAAMASTTTEEVTPADEVYVTDSGDAVLVYKEDSTPNTTGEYGFDVAENLLYTFMAEENATTGAAEGTLGLEVDPETFVADGHLQAPAPPDTQTLDLSVTGEHTDDTATANASFDVVIQNTTDDLDTQMAQMTNEGTALSTAGNLSLTSDRVASNGTAEVTNVHIENDSYFAATLTGTTTGFTLDVEQHETVNESEVGLWNTTENANRTLHELFANGTAEQFNGSADVTLVDGNHQFHESNNSLAMAYTVEFTDVREGMGEQLATELANADQLNESQANELANAATDIDVQSIAVEMDADADAGTVTSSWTVDVQNLGPVTDTVLNISQANTDGFDAELQEARDRFDAAESSGYAQTVAWDVSIEETTDTTAFSGTLDYDTANRAAYTDALATRGIETDNLEYELNAQLLEQTDELEVNASVTVEGKNLLDRALDSAISTLRNNPDTNDDVASLFDAVDAADLQQAKVDVSVRDRTVEFQSGAKFENISEFQSVMSNEFGGQQVAHLYGDINTEGENQYVYLADAVGENASEEEVRALDVVDDNTTVNLPGEGWNESDLPRLNTTKGNAYLGIQDDDGSDGGDDGDSGDDNEFISDDGDGFGAAIALISLLIAALMARRRD